MGRLTQPPAWSLATAASNLVVLPSRMGVLERRGPKRHRKLEIWGAEQAAVRKKPLEYLTNFFAAAQLEQTNFRYSFSSFSVSLSSLSCLGFKNLYLSAFDIQTLNICQLKKNYSKQTTVEA